MSQALMIEKDFVNTLIKSQKPTAIFLKNGIKLSGIIVSTDEQCI